MKLSISPFSSIDQLIDPHSQEGTMAERLERLRELEETFYLFKFTLECMDEMEITTYPSRPSGPQDKCK